MLPGTTIHTDMWAAYNGLGALGYIHHTVNHTVGFIDPATGVHTNTVEGSWKHAKTYKRGNRSVEDALYEYRWRKRFNACSGPNQLPNAFNGLLTTLAACNFY